MAPARLLTACIVAAIVIAAASEHVEISKEYLGQYELLYSPHKALASLSYVNLEGVDSYDQFIERLRRHEDINPELRSWWSFFNDLAKTDDDCNDELHKQFVAVYRGMEMLNMGKYRQILLDFVMHHGKEKFDKCARKALEKIETRSKANEELNAVENFFKRVVFLDENASDVDLYRALMQKTVKKATWNVDWLVSVEHEYKAKGGHDRPFLENCGLSNRHFRNLLDNINFAKYLNPDREYFKGNMNLKKLNEIGRICIAISRYHNDFKANLESQIGLKQRVLKPIAKIFGA